MTPFLEQLEKNCIERKDQIATTLNSEEIVTYGELWSLSGKVYAYLRRHGIGKEDFVLINLSRGPKIVIAHIGIWRAGAACTITEKGYPADRVEHIKQDCQAKLVLDEAVFCEMLTYDALDGCETVDPHDACFAVYTSGSTGRPKGVLHEYGKIDTCLRCYNINEEGVESFAAIFPLNFVVYYIETIHNLYAGKSFYILSYDMVKNVSLLTDFIDNEQIDSMFMTPTMLKIVKTLPESLKTVITGGEAASGIYCKKPQLCNGYSTSEVGFQLTRFTIDKPYRITPVGKNLGGLDVLVLDEKGSPVPDGSQGEVCVRNDYFRGYIDMPEQTAAVLIDGIYHTGDIGYKNENGDLVICGRIDDMININGNRIEPQEIEIVAKEVLQVNNIIAKGFDNSYVALYGLAAEIGDSFDDDKIPALREELGKQLPQYMVPEYFVALDAFPVNANGKTTRRLLPAPDTRAQAANYVPPANETEEVICQNMAEVLGVQQVGRHDDFYRLGGDSLKTILLVTNCGRLNLESADVYRYRTPERIAAFCDKNHTGAGETEKFNSAQAMEETFYPRMREAYRTYGKTGIVPSVYSSCFAADETGMKKVSMSPSSVFCLKEKVDPKLLQAAVDRAVEACPYAAFDIIKKDGLICFKKNDLPLTIHRMGTLDEFGTSKNNNHYTFVGYEENKIQFVMSHVLTDGFGINCFVQAVLDYYFGKETTRYDGSDKPDFTADLMAEALPLPSTYEPKDYKVNDHFVPPEIGPAAAEGTYKAHFEISAEKFEQFCKDYEMSAQIGISYVLARAVQNAHPDNNNVVSVRGPVNTRTLLGVPNTFQNASVPHIFLNFEPEALEGELSPHMLERVKKNFADQFTYENLASFTNRTREALTSSSTEERDAFIRAYKTQTDLFANYLGKTVRDDIAESIESVCQEIPVSYPVMLYALRYGDVLSLQLIQAFDDPVYAESLRKILVQYGWAI